MAKIMLICGKICAGKSTYSRKLMTEQPAVRLNADELMKTILGEHLGDAHEEYLHRTLQYIYPKAVEIYSTGLNVVIDCGFWQKHYRDEANQYFSERGIKPEWHYIDIDDNRWKLNIQKRNHDVKHGLTDDFFVDQNILAKFSNPDDIPTHEEMDVWYHNV